MNYLVQLVHRRFISYDTENEILKIFNNLAHKENKCIIIVTHLQNVCDNVDEVYELKKNK